MSWMSIADLLTNDPAAPVALLGAPLAKGAVTPGRCDLAPETVRRALKRLSTFDLVERLEIDVAVHDAGDIAVAALTPAEAFAPVRDALAASVTAHDLTLLIGGNNAVTRPAAHALGLPLAEVGLITFDGHFDMRETDQGPTNGNPVRCLLEDGLPGRNICQIGLASFANTRKMYDDADDAGIGIWDIDEVQDEGIINVIDAALEQLSHVEAILVDFDIDVIERSQCPGAPGARPGGLPVGDFFRAARRMAEEARVRVVDLTEFDPSLDVSDISALTAGRWVCEILAGFKMRG